jgi:hypothetical protein
MFRTKALIPVMAAIVLLAGVSGAHALESATIQALANVVTTLSIIGVNNLQFGSVNPGTNKSVDKSTPGLAGEWEITGDPAAEISLEFELPDSLMHVDSAAGLPCIFANSDASYSDGTGTQFSPTGTLNPNTFSAKDIGAGGTMTVWIGGTVLPRVGQAGGPYAADVILTVMYTGN